MTKQKKNKLEKNFYHIDNRKEDKVNIKTKKVRKDEVIDEDYLDFIRNQGCCVKACKYSNVKVFSHHIVSRHLGRRDDKTVPLCGFHHNLSKDAIHIMGKISWQEKFEVDIEELALRLRKEYNDKGCK